MDKMPTDNVSHRPDRIRTGQPDRRQAPASFERIGRPRQGQPSVLSAHVELTRRDARLYVAANGLGSFGLGVTAFYLNFLYRALGFGDARIGSLASGLALGAVLGALPATLAARRLSRRAT